MDIVRSIIKQIGNVNDLSRLCVCNAEYNKLVATTPAITHLRIRNGVPLKKYAKPMFKNVTHLTMAANGIKKELLNPNWFNSVTDLTYEPRVLICPHGFNNVRCLTVVGRNALAGLNSIRSQALANVERLNVLQLDGFATLVTALGFFLKRLTNLRYLTIELKVIKQTSRTCDVTHLNIWMPNLQELTVNGAMLVFARNLTRQLINGPQLQRSQHSIKFSVIGAHNVEFYSNDIETLRKMHTISIKWFPRQIQSITRAYARLDGIDHTNDPKLTLEIRSIYARSASRAFTDVSKPSLHAVKHIDFLIGGEIPPFSILQPILAVPKKSFVPRCTYSVKYDYKVLRSIPYDLCQDYAVKTLDVWSTIIAAGRRPKGKIEVMIRRNPNSAGEFDEMNLAICQKTKLNDLYYELEIQKINTDINHDAQVEIPF